MKNRPNLRLDIVKWYKELFTKDPVTVTVSFTILLSIIILYLSWGTYNNQWEELFVQLVAEAHGMVFDILIICILFVWINKVSDRKKLIASCLEDIDDLRLRNADIEKVYQGQENDGPAQENRMKNFKLRGSNWGDNETVRLKLIKAIKVLARNRVTEIDLHNINVSGGKFISINLRRSNLNGSLAVDCNFDFANLSDSQCCDTNFDGSCMDNMNAEGAKAIGASFVGASLNFVNFESAKLISADLKESYITSAKFRNAVCTGADFTGAHVIKSDFRGAIGLTAHQLLKAHYIHNCKFDPSLEASIKMEQSVKKKLSAEIDALKPIPMTVQKVG